MKTILFYVSDHGFGHATRCIALTRKLQKNYKIIIKNHNAFKFLKNSLMDGNIFDMKTDVGPAYNWKTQTMEYGKTQLDFDRFIKKENSWIEKEINFCKKINPDLIISDISPISLRLSHKMNIPSISIANFSWSDIIETFPESEKRNDILHWLDESFSLSTLVLQLPLHMNLRGYLRKKNASLLTREINVSKSDLIEKLGIKKKVILSYSNHDIFFSNQILKNFDILQMKQNYMFLNYNKIDDIFEGQNLTSLASCVVSKIGYGVVSDCLKNKIPMLLISRKNYPEDIAILKRISNFNIFLPHNDSPNSQVGNDEIHNVLSLKKSFNHTEIKKLEKEQNCDEIIQQFLQ